MKIEELEDGEKIVTKDYLRAELAALELRIVQQIIASERAQRGWMIGTYALIVGALLVNHFWR